MRRLLRLSAVALAVALTLASCGDSDDDDGGGSGGGGETTTTTAAAQGPSIEKFSIDATVTCSGDTADVKAEWETSGAESVSFAVDGEPVPADAGQPLSGDGNIPVPCDGSAHDVTLTASGAGGQDSSDTQSVTTESS